MFSRIFFIIILFISFSGNSQHVEIDKDQLLNHLQILSADAMEGRGFGTTGGKKATEYMEKQFRQLGLKPVFDGTYVQPFIGKYKEQELNGYNVVGAIPGKSDKIILVTAHFDHLGIKEGVIYNGADDNASGAAALFSIGEYFLKNKPEYTILLAAVDAEEVGSIGANYLLENFPLDTSEIALNVNLDMIGHNDNNELYAAGTFHYPKLKAPLEKIDSPVNLLFGHDNKAVKGMDDWTYASDHRVFHRKNIPFIYFGVEDHKDYHKPSDTYEEINKEFYVDAVKLVIKAIEQFDRITL